MSSAGPSAGRFGAAAPGRADALGPYLRPVAPSPFGGMPARTGQGTIGARWMTVTRHVCRSPRPPCPPPPRFVERRAQSRREADRIAHEERVLLARALDVLAAGDAPEQRLAGLLDLLAQTVGAERAAVVADGVARRVAVAATGPDDHDAAIGLATWLDSAAPRSRARRAAARRAPISVVLRGTDAGSPTTSTAKSAAAERDRPTWSMPASRSRPPAR